MSVVKLEDLLRLYALQPTSTKWILRGGDILEYIGQRMAMLEFTEKDDKSWDTEVKPVIIKSIKGFDKNTGLYKITYVLEGDEEKEITEKIIPQGLTEIKGKIMRRFTPYSVHLALMEKMEFFNRVARLYKEKKNMDLKKIKEFSETKRLGDIRNIGAIVKAADESGTLMYIRAVRLELVHHLNLESHLFIHTDRGHRLHAVFNDGDKEFTLKEKGNVILGTLKLVDLQE